MQVYLVMEHVVRYSVMKHVVRRSYKYSNCRGVFCTLQNARDAAVKYAVKWKFGLEETEGFVWCRPNEYSAQVISNCVHTLVSYEVIEKTLDIPEGEEPSNERP